jgi:hypothetical protein
MKGNRTVIEPGVAAISDAPLAESLLDEFDELNNRFYLGDFRPSELSGGRFSEAAFRICQQVCLGTYTPLGKTLPRVDQLVIQLENVPSSTADDSFRLHIPRSLRVIYDLRNKRDVGHLGTGAIVPNFSDSTLIVSIASWVVSEIVRISHSCDMQTATALVESLVQRRAPLIWEDDDVIRVLHSDLSYKDQVLLLLYHVQPERVPDRKLFEWTEYSNFSKFRADVLGSLHDDRLIEYRNREAIITPKGNVAIDAKLRN